MYEEEHLTRDIKYSAFDTFEESTSVVRFLSPRITRAVNWADSTYGIVAFFPMVLLFMGIGAVRIILLLSFISVHFVSGIDRLYINVEDEAWFELQLLDVGELEARADDDQLLSIQLLHDMGANIYSKHYLDPQ